MRQSPLSLAPPDQSGGRVSSYDRRLAERARVLNASKLLSDAAAHAIRGDMAAARELARLAMPYMDDGRAVDDLRESGAV